MKKTLIAATTTLLLATGAAYADSSLLDVQGAPDRGTSQGFLPDFAETDAAPAVDFTPTAAIEGSIAQDGIYSADNGFGDYSPGYFGQVR